MTNRKFPIGAEVTDEGVNFRVYAPLCKSVDVVSEDGAQKYPLKAERKGYFSATIPQLTSNSLYRFSLDNSQEHYPDPASRFQPDGPFGPSQVVNPKDYHWTDQNWKGRSIKGQVIYEMHIGTFTQEGTYLAAQEQLKELADLGITIIELMPLNEFPGKFNWGYDGVNLFSPAHVYGTPDDLRSFIDTAHSLSLCVILDVVYNHFGPEGNFIDKFATDYFLEKDTDWGKAIDFDHHAAREFFLTNAQYWIDEFHFDGLRVDATQNIYCTTTPHIHLEIQRVARAAAPNKKILIIGENESQESIIFRSVEKGGYGFDALWNDDFHHSALVRLTGKREAYYTDYTGNSEEIGSCLRFGFLYQGQYYSWQEKNRGTPCLDIPKEAFILFTQNHDQIANTGHGMRLNQFSDKGNLKAMTSLMVLSPCTPMLFQGQEFAATTPFYYFADHPEELTNLIHEGRKSFLSQFNSLASEEVQEQILNPGDPDVFMKSKLNFDERISNAKLYQFHKDLIKLRHIDPVISDPKSYFTTSTINSEILILRYFGESNQDRLLLFNFGVDFKIEPAWNPLLAPPKNCSWKTIFTSDSLNYEGNGTRSFDKPQWILPGHSVYVFSSMLKDKYVKG